MDQFDAYFQYQKEVAEAKLKIISRLKKADKGRIKKRTSKIDIARNVLNAAGIPLHVSKIIQLAERQYQIKLDRDSIVSAMLKKARAGKTFIRTAPNTFALKKYIVK
jgi:hypothetical protein